MVGARVLGASLSALGSVLWEACSLNGPEIHCCPLAAFAGAVMSVAPTMCCVLHSQMSSWCKVARGEPHLAHGIKGIQAMQSNPHSLFKTSQQRRRGHWGPSLSSTNLHAVLHLVNTSCPTRHLQPGICNAWHIGTWAGS